MKTIYILLTRSGTLLSNLVYRLTGARYTHASLAFDEDLSCLYSSTRKNGYTTLQDLHCVYEGWLSGLPQRQNMDFGGDETVVSVYLGLALGLVKAGVRQIF